MNIAICDDDIRIIESLKGLIEEYFSEKNIPFSLSCFSDGKELINTDEIFDLVIADIEMPDVNGIAAAKYAQSVNENTVIMIVTDHQEYLDDAMDINVYRYLPKPVDKERFLRGLEGALIRYMKISVPVVIETENETLKLCSGDIIYLAIDNRYVTVYTKKGEFRTRKSMNWWKSYLNPHIFTQCHKSFLVNLKYVTNFTKEEVTLTVGGKNYSCHCSRRFYLKFKEAFFNFLSVNKSIEGGI